MLSKSKAIQDPNFDRLMRKNALESEIKAVKDVLANVEKRVRAINSQN